MHPRVRGWSFFCDGAGHRSMGAIKRAILVNVGAVFDGGCEPIGAGIVLSTDGEGTLRAGQRMGRGKRGNQGVSRAARA